MASNFSVWVDVFLKGVVWWLIPLLSLFIYRKSLRKYPIECVIYEKRGENIVHSRDMAGRFEEPVTCYKLKIAKDSIPIVQYDWVLQHMGTPTNIFEKITNLLTGKTGTITLFKYGSKQYKPVDVKIGGKVVKRFKEIKDANGESKWVTIYEPINVKKEMSRLDFEVIDWDDINHMTQEIRASIQRRAKMQDWIARYGPVIGLGIIAMVFIIACYFTYQMLMSAGDRYINAAQNVEVVPANIPPVDLPLDEYLPE